MRLELASFPVREVRFGSRMYLEGGVLEVDRQALLAPLEHEPAIAWADLALAEPGESVRVVHVLDTLEPRLKVDGPGHVFPGLAGPPHTVGTGKTHRLAGIALLQSALFPEPADGLFRAREALVDMSGPAAPFCPLAETHNLVVMARGQQGVSNVEFDAALRRASVQMAALLAELTRDQEPETITTYDADIEASGDGLPRVVYIDQVHAQGLFARTFVYGHDSQDFLPTLMHPNELMDGALVSGNYAYGALKTPTWLHCNNPVIESLYRRHGVDLSFAGVILSKGHNYTFALKERSARYAAHLAALLHADGVVLTHEGGGNAGIDALLTVKACEELGIKTVFITTEMGGLRGIDQPLVDNVPEADAIVSGGSYEKHLMLPAMERAIGDDHIEEYSVGAADSFEINLTHVYCAANQLGRQRTQAVAF
jgi:glycine reductase complex component B subunit alpha and beta